MEQETHRQTLYRSLRVIAAVAWLGLILYAFLHRRAFTLENILSYTPESPLLAFAVLMLFFAFKSLTVVFYAGFLYAAAGALFPLPSAIAANVCGTLIMALIPYVFARNVGAAHADELRKKYPRLRRLEQTRSRNSFAFVVVLRCVNFVNFDVGSMYCGAVRLAPAVFLPASLLGKAADIVVWSVMGANLGNPASAPFLIALGVDLCLALAVVLWTWRQNRKEPNA